jgi:hypothetical protein
MFEPAGPNKMRLTATLHETVSDLQGVRHNVTIEPGYEFDGASIPRIAWAVIGAPFEPDYCLAACVHDWYCEQSTLSKDYQSRVIGDAVFFALLSRAGVPRWRRVLMYLAVRLHSWFQYGRYT